GFVRPIRGFHEAKMRKSAFLTSSFLPICLLVANNGAAETRKETAASYVELGDKFAREGDFQRAIGAYKIALEFAPDVPQALFRRAVAYEARGNMREALADYTSVLSLLPESAAAWYNRGNVRLKESDFDGAVSDFDRALENNPGYAMAYNNRGIAKIGK